MSERERKKKAEDLPVVLVARGDSTEADAVGVANVGVFGLAELEAGGPAVADHVVHLLADFVIREGGQVGEGLEELHRVGSLRE